MYVKHINIYLYNLLSTFPIAFAFLGFAARPLVWIFATRWDLDI